MARRIRWLAPLIAAVVVLSGCVSTWEQVPSDTPYGEDHSTYYYDLAPYGTWVDVAPYGPVWCPDGVASAWQPYTVGYWVYTDDGWFWVSEDPWGWAPYHYGRWAFDDDYGWVWVPGSVWAPAWVAWRYGSGWVGWAPLPPEVSWLDHVGIEISSYDLDRHIHRGLWSFLRAQDFGLHRVRVRVEPADRNEALLKQTRNVTKYAAGPRPVEEGMRPDLIRELSGKKIERYRIVDSKKPVPKGGLTIRGRQAEVYRPNVDVGVVRERVRSAMEPKSSKPTRPTIKRAGRDHEQRDERESRVAEREEREVSREPRVRQETVSQVQKPIDEQPRTLNEDARRIGERQIAISDARARQRDETGGQRDKGVRQREAVPRDGRESDRPTGIKREEAARQREEVARAREKERKPEAKAQESPKEAPKAESEAGKPEPEARGRGDRERAKDAGKPEVQERHATAHERAEAQRERKDGSKERARGR